MNQTHKNIEITVSVKATINGLEETLFKNVIIEPIDFGTLTDTPIATYVQLSLIGGYKQNTLRSDKSLFSNTSKDVLDIAYVAFAIPNPDGTLSFNDTYINELRELRNHGVRLVISIDGANASASADFLTITSSDELIDTFTSNIVNLVETYKFDGVDIDWESTTTTTVEAQKYNKLIISLRNKLNASQDTGGSNYLLTSAIPATSWGATLTRFDFPTLNQYLDIVNMMSYDAGKKDIASHNAPLYQSSNDEGWNFGVDYGVNRFRNLGLTTCKILIGMACYGKTYFVASLGDNPSYPGLGGAGSLKQIPSVQGSFASGTIYMHAISGLLNNPEYVLYHEYNNNNKFVGSYIFNATSKILITFDSTKTAEEKLKYAQGSNQLGLMSWAYTEDYHDVLIDTLYRQLNQ